MTTERDLAADLALCEAATPGPWRYEDGDVNRRDPRPAVLTYFDYEEGEWFIHADFADKDDAIFSAAAREGWPIAIRRAMAAEAKLQYLLYICGELAEGADRPEQRIVYREMALVVGEMLAEREVNDIANED